MLYDKFRLCRDIRSKTMRMIGINILHMFFIYYLLNQLLDLWIYLDSILVNYKFHNFNDLSIEFA